jgi:hypothetical protein
MAGLCQLWWNRGRGPIEGSLAMGKLVLVLRSSSSQTSTKLKMDEEHLTTAQAAKASAYHQ